MKQDIRQMPLDEIRVIKGYYSMLPRPCDEDYHRLYEDIKTNGLDPSRPLVVNENLVVLDGHTRLDIAKKLKLPWAWVTIKETDDHWTEKEFVIMSNLARRHLNTAQRADMGLTLLEIEQARARERQKLAGAMYGRGIKTPEADSSVPNEYQAIPNQGRTIVNAAKQVGVGKDTLYRAVVVQAEAKRNPEIARAWEKAKEGKTTVAKVFNMAKESKRREEPVASPPPAAPPDQEEPQAQENDWFTREELIDLLYDTAEKRGDVCLASLQWVTENDKDVLYYWEKILKRVLIPKIGWGFIMDRVERYEEAELAKLETEKPLPPGIGKVGPWELDFVHQATVHEIADSFPEEMAHLVITDAEPATLPELKSLARLAMRALVPGKCLCAYVDTGILPEAMQIFSGVGLKYFWLCSVIRPNLQVEIEDKNISKRWHAMLIYQKPTPSRKTGKFEDMDDAEEMPVPNSVYETIKNDCLVSRRLYVREMPRQLIDSLTLPGQLIVDPFTRNGVMGMVAAERKRRYLLFDTDQSNATAINFRIKQEIVWTSSKKQTK